MTVFKDVLQIEPATREETEFRHGGWTVRRCQVWASLKRIGTRDANLTMFAQCGSSLWLKRNTEGTDVKLVCNKCHNRMCIPCGNDRAALITENLAQILDAKHTRFMTFTLRHSQTPLRDQLHRLRHSFNMLRRHKSWKESVRGGAAFLEVKISEKDGMWHPHLHLMVEGQFWDQREISREWHCVTGDSSIVHIKAMDDVAAMARYVTKYVTKPASKEIFCDAEKLDEFICAMKGQRLCFTFGSWRGLKLEEVPDDNVTWISVGNVSYLKSKATDGDEDAKRWIGVASRKWPLLAKMFSWNVPNTS